MTSKHNCKILMSLTKKSNVVLGLPPLVKKFVSDSNQNPLQSIPYLYKAIHQIYNLKKIFVT